MRLREDAVYIRLATTHDAHDNGAYADVIADCEQLAGEAFATFRDLAAVRAAEFDLDAVRAVELDTLRGGGLYRRVRFRLTAPGGTSLEWNAGTHPYSGVYVTQIDARFPYSRLGAAATEGVDRLFRRWVAALEPLWAHAHDADDNAVQNAASDVIVRLGFGVDPASLGDDRPGLEQSRGELRYAVNWRTFVSRAMLDRLAPFADPAVLAESVEIDEGALFALPGHPNEANGAAARDEQRRLRSGLGLDAVAERERWTHGYWQRTRPHDAR